MEVMEVNRENLSVILIDHGVVDNHLPNNVLKAIKTFKTRFMSSPETYNREAIEEMRERRENLLRNIRTTHENLTEWNPAHKRCRFPGVSTIQEEPEPDTISDSLSDSISDTMGTSNMNCYNLGNPKKRSIHGTLAMTDLHPDAGGRGLKMPASDDEMSMLLGEVTVKADVTEYSECRDEDTSDICAEGFDSSDICAERFDICAEGFGSSDICAEVFL